MRNVLCFNALNRFTWFYTDRITKAGRCLIKGLRTKKNGGETPNKLDGQGRARREAAWRRNFECKINLNSPNYSRSNGSRPTAVQRAVIGRRRVALVAAPRRRPVTGKEGV